MEQENKKTNQKQREIILTHLQGDYTTDNKERLTDDHMKILELQYQRQAITEQLDNLDYKSWFKNASNFWRYSNAYNEIRVAHEYDDLLHPYINDNRNNEPLVALQDQLTIWKSFATFLADRYCTEYDEYDMPVESTNPLTQAWNEYLDHLQDWMLHGEDTMYEEWKNIDITQL